MYRGYYIRMYGKECFIITNKQKRTKVLALDFINKVQNKLNKFTEVTEKDIEYIQNSMILAILEHKTLSNGLKYIDIYGENFGGYGCEPCENPLDYVCIVE